jgi:hypothetical protein
MTSEQRPHLPRIYADANDQSNDGGYELGFDESLRNIADAGSAIYLGARVLLNVQDELEIVATLGFDDQCQMWLGYPDFSTIRNLS